VSIVNALSGLKTKHVEHQQIKIPNTFVRGIGWVMILFMCRSKNGLECIESAFYACI